MYSVASFMYSVSSYFYSFTSNQFCLILFSLLFLYSVSHTVREHVVPQILSCGRFRNNLIESRKFQIQNYKNIENGILNSNKNIVEKTETWKMLKELHSL